MNQHQQNTEPLLTKLNRETSKITWKELQRFFAAGTVIQVDRELDLVRVAVAVSQDRKTEIEAWMAASRVARVTDEQAQTWYAADATLWAVVVKPWVLVQEIGPGKAG